MGARIVFIGEETAAAGWRLAGVATRVARRGEEAAALREETGRAALVLVERASAARIAPHELRRALAARSPLVLVLPDPLEPAAADVGARVRLQLGLAPA